MLKYQLDNISPDGARTVAYVKLYDDSAPAKILATICVPYETQAQFEADLEAKTRKYLDSVAGKAAIASLAALSLGNVEKKINEVKK